MGRVPIDVNARYSGALGTSDYGNLLFQLLYAKWDLDDLKVFLSWKPDLNMSFEPNGEQTTLDWFAYGNLYDYRDHSLPDLDRKIAKLIQSGLDHCGRGNAKGQLIDFIKKNKLRLSLVEMESRTCP